MQVIHAKFDDIDKFCHTLKTWDSELYPLSSIQPAESAGNLLVQTGVWDCQYMFCGFSSPFKMFGAPPKGLITFNVMEVTQRRYWWRGHDLDSEMVWVFPVGGELRSISAPGFKVHTLSVTEEKIAAVAAGCGIDLPPPSKRPEVYPAPDKAMESIRSHLRRMRNWSALFPHESVDEILSLFVSLWLKPGVWNDRRRPLMRARDRAVRKSLEIMEECNLSTLTPEFLRKECNVSKRTMEYAVRERFGTSPAALIKSIRLAAAKADLRRADCGQQRIADIIAKSGFCHPAQFAADYRKAFGELPSETLRKRY